MSNYTVNDYMERPEEIEKYKAICQANGFTAPEDGARKLCEAMAGNDATVFAAMWAIWNFENAFDDLIDQPGISENLKLLSMTVLHDAILEALDSTDATKAAGADFGRLMEVWKCLVDRTHWSKARKILAANARTKFFGVLRFNPFVRTHRDQIKAMLVQTMLRCISGDLLAMNADPRKRALAAAVRCGDVDLFMHFIYLARGFAAATTWCGKLGYDTPDPAAPGAKEGNN